MAKRARGEGQKVTLFPFLSILACVIGTLILMISSLALSQMHTPPDEKEIERAQEFVALEKEKADLLVRRESLSKTIQDTGDLAAKLKRARSEIERLLELDRKRQLSDRRSADEASTLAAEKERLETLLKDLLAERAELDKQIPPLKAELAKRKDVPDEAVVQVAPGGSGKMGDLRPAFVEATATGLVLHDGSKPVTVPKSSVKSHKGYLALLARVAKDPKTILIFLIREDGVGSYHLGRSVAASKGARNGMLPLVGQGNLDLSLFNKGR